MVGEQAVFLKLFLLPEESTTVPQPVGEAVAPHRLPVKKGENGLLKLRRNESRSVRERVSGSASPDDQLRDQRAAVLNERVTWNSPSNGKRAGIRVPL